MYRCIHKYLLAWKGRTPHLPLILRGARQVGKTWALKEFGNQCFARTAYVDLQEDPRAAGCFEAQKVSDIVTALEAFTGVRIVAGETLLILDEVQDHPRVLERLRYFAEQFAELHVIVTGSSLDPALCNARLPMPVGRVEYLHMGPLSFAEAVAATRPELAAALAAFSIATPPLAPVHDLLMEALRCHALVGGMPAVVNTWRDSRSLVEALRVQRALLTSYRDDLSKYARRSELPLLGRVLDAVPRLIGTKAVLSRIAEEAKAASVRAAIDLLALGGIIHCVHASAGNGLPLEAEADDRTFKILLNDVGLIAAGSDLAAARSQPQDFSLVNEGPLAEALAGQELRAIVSADLPPRLHYWVREGRTANAEVDYLIALCGQVLPVECKAGSSGSLKSLHQFMAAKHRPLAVRVAARPLAIEDIATRTPDGKDARYRLLTVPPYAIGRLPDLVAEAGV